jgi:hypothetical protein
MKSIIRAILLCASALLLGLPARADGTSPTASFVSQYMFRGTRLGGPSFQPSLQMDSGSFEWGIWANTPIMDKVSGQSAPEIDPYVSYAFGSDTFNITPGITLYDYPKAPTGQGFYRTTYEPNIALNYVIASGVKFTPKVYYDMVLESLTYEFTITCATPLKSFGTELDWTATGGTFMTKDYYNGADPKEKNWGNYYLIGVSAPFRITENSKLKAGFAYTSGTDNYFKHGQFPQMKNQAAGGRGVVSLSYSYTF